MHRLRARPVGGTKDGWVAFTPTGRYKLGGATAGLFWYAINLCRFEPGELDPFLPPGTLVRVQDDEPLWTTMWMSERETGGGLPVSFSPTPHPCS